MAASLGEEFEALAVDEITNGDLWTHEATFTYGPRRIAVNKWDEATTGAVILPQILRVAAEAVEKSLEEGGRKITMWEIYVPAKTILVRPTEEDTVTLDGKKNEILSSPPLTANGVDAVYVILAKR